MRKIEMFKDNGFKDKAFSLLLVHESPDFKILNFNFKAGQSLPVHSHDLDGQVSIAIIEGEGEFLGENDASMPARTGDVLVCDIREPHGVRATTDMRVLVHIAPPI